MNCTYGEGKCRNRWKARRPIWTTQDSLDAIAAGWRVWKSWRDGVGDPALRDGEALCPEHAQGPGTKEGT